MNKFSRVLTVTVILLLTCIASGFAKEYDLADFKTSNSRNGEKFSVGYDTGYESYYILQDSPYSGTNHIYLDSLQLEELRNAVKKALDWNKIAIESGKTVDKDLPNTITRCKFRTSYKNANQPFLEQGYVSLQFRHKYADGHSEFKLSGYNVDYTGTQRNSNFPVQTMKFSDGVLNAFGNTIEKEYLEKLLNDKINPAPVSKSGTADDPFV